MAALTVTLKIGKPINAYGQYEQQVTFMGMNCNTQLVNHCDKVYGKGQWSTKKLDDGSRLLILKAAQ